jgi:hypothetical protein
VQILAGIIHGELRRATDDCANGEDSIAKSPSEHLSRLQEGILHRGKIADFHRYIVIHFELSTPHIVLSISKLLALCAALSVMCYDVLGYV